MNADVEKAVEFMDGCITTLPGGNQRDWQTIRQALRDQDAEIAQLQAALSKHVNRICELADARALEHTAMTLRTEKADALLRECLQCMSIHPATYERITAHLGAEQ